MGRNKIMRDMIENAENLIKLNYDKEMLEENLIDSLRLIQRIEKIIDMFDESPSLMLKDKIMSDMIENAEKLIKRSYDEEVMEAGLIGSLQLMNHYEIACYGTARDYSRVLYYNDIASLLHNSVEDEKMADRDLAGLAEQSNNRIARFPAMMV